MAAASASDRGLDVLKRFQVLHFLSLLFPFHCGTNGLGALASFPEEPEGPPQGMLPAHPNMGRIHKSIPAQDPAYIKTYLEVRQKFHTAF